MPETEREEAAKSVTDVITTHSDPDAGTGATEFNNFSDGDTGFSKSRR
jgi:hypothetical protein